MRSLNLNLRFRLLLIAALAVVAIVFAPNEARAQWRATVGAQSWDSSRQALAFLPNELWIHAGDDITWTFQAGEIHTVTFLATSPAAQVRPPLFVGCPPFSEPAMFDGTACISTPPLVKGASFKVAFPAVGNFKLVCLVHPDMTGVVHVIDKAKPLPHDQIFYDAEAAAQAQALLSDRDGEDDDVVVTIPGHVSAGSGEISTTGPGAQTLSVMRFMSHEIIVHAGQTVEWDNKDPEDPHTITFGKEPAGDPFPPSNNVTVDADGARHAVINSLSDSVHSGFIQAAPQDRTGLPQAPISVTRFRVTFTHPGIYPYICTLHDNLGMKGQIVVLP